MKKETNRAILERMDATLLWLRAKVEKLLPEATKPAFPPIDKPREPLYPCGQWPTPAHEPIPMPAGEAESDSFDIDPSRPGRRHRVYMLAGTTVRYTLPAGQTKAYFSMAHTPKYGYPVQGERPSLDRWVTDASGQVLVREDGMQITGGGFRVPVPFAGPIYLHIKTTDFTGWLFVEWHP